MSEEAHQQVWFIRPEDEKDEILATNDKELALAVRFCIADKDSPVKLIIEEGMLTQSQIEEFDMFEGY